MSQKLKYKENKDLYRLNMTFDEAILIRTLLNQVRLGNPVGAKSEDAYRKAAFTLLEAFDNLDFDDSSEYVDIGVSIESVSGEEVISFTDGPDVGIVFEVSEKDYDCGNGCSGCDCK